jgi:ribonuclease HI
MVRIPPGAIQGVLCGGWAYLFSDRLTGLIPGREHSGTVYGALGDTGADGLPKETTDRRADLRAVLEALQASAELGVGWDRIVVMTHSEYVVDGMTKKLRVWAGSGWLTPLGAPVTRNMDL